MLFFDVVFPSKEALVHLFHVSKDDCVSVTAMVHQHYEPSRNMADRPYGPAAPPLPAEDSHQDCQSEMAAFHIFNLNI